MRYAFGVCLGLIAGCSAPNLGVAVQQAAVSNPKSCSINGASYDQGQPNPTNPCEVCNAERNATGWSDADNGTRCDDGNSCTRRDTCQAGACVGTDALVCKPRENYHNPVKVECCLRGTATIGLAGGTVSTGNGTSVEIPPGAVPNNTTITIAESNTPAPKGAVSPVIDFGPDGIVFAHPVKVTIPLTSTVGKLTTFWTKHDGSGQFEPVGGTVVADRMVVDVTHFSSGYVAADPGTRTINGTEQVTWLAANQTTIQPVDLTTLPVEALVADGSGGYTSYPGLGASDGSFSISGVPAGVVILHAATQYTALDITNYSIIDLGYGVNGRFDEAPASNASSLVFDVANMLPWQDGDDLELSCSNNDWIFGVETLGFNGLPSPGDTAINNLTIPENGIFQSIGSVGNLIVGDKGDVCTLAHLQARQTSDATPIPYIAMTEVFAPAPFDQVDGGVSTISGSFVANTTPSSVSIDLQMQDYLPLLGPLPAGATTTLTGDGFFILGAPGGDLSIRSGGNTADFMELDLTANPVHTVATNLQYGQPLSGSWDTFAVAAAGVVYRFDVTSVNRFPSFHQDVITTLDLNGTAPTPLAIAPRLSAVQAAAINGLDLVQSQSGVGVTPTLTWTAPSLGTPNVYQVDVVHIINARPPKQTVATFATTDTSLTLPAGILVAGDPYFFVITAFNKKTNAADPSTPITVAPFHFADVLDSANVISGQITP